METHPVRTTPRPSRWIQVTSALRHPASVAFGMLWFLAALTLVLRGQGQLLLQTAISLGLLFCVALLLLLWLSPDPPEADSTTTQPRSRIWLQVAVLMVFILLTGWSGMKFHHLTTGSIPLWSPLESALETAGGRLFGADNWVRNPVLYMVLPGLILLFMGARPSELGLRKGYRSWFVVLPWAIVVLVWAVVAGVTGQVRLALRIPMRLFDNFMQNGFMEEFLFRGALMTRLAPLAGQNWSLVLSSLLFGVWHLGADTAMLQGDYIAGFAFAIVSQATLGLLFGIMAVRTRSLIAPTAAHIIVNTLG